MEGGGENGSGSAATKLMYFDDMWKLQAPAVVLAMTKESDRDVVILDQTILYPQGGGQPCDTGSIVSLDGTINFCVTDVRSKSGVVYHYGKFDGSNDVEASFFQPKQEVNIFVDGARRQHNSRLHSAGHLLDSCMRHIGLGSLEPGKGHHFPDGPFVEYKGAIPSKDLESKRVALELDANHLIKCGGQVRAEILPYSEAAALCGGTLPDYIAKDSWPRIVCLGENPGCPCGGTHVADISEIGDVKVTQIRIKKGVTKVSYNVVAANA